MARGCRRSAQSICFPHDALFLFPAGLVPTCKVLSPMFAISGFGSLFTIPSQFCAAVIVGGEFTKGPCVRSCSLQTPLSRRVNQPDFTLQVPEPRFSRLPAVDCLDLFASLLALIHTQHATLLGGESA
ncbi:hypothetical protein, variant 1 [Blastomyces dermatitidis ER-3]|uniref:Uncharacterized protein n=1 Tax=Ajellomyces dermatitidis (strain ER-3 / ATCC MYA-2586) TaxID=559297 RepID=A0ABX2W0H5_AJEDR|nr:hypothetical protein, variant 2 [Blastomyces dermatitidis ER-3]XP_045282608.1 uncharacterized protein BDCG_08586 [Blastomyces dermatitidis ER-3]XP_045282609.1 hypothetical protein, variant 1 [Blastomyces dermatitidis ER-3]EEQ85317.1 hypothetical protein, variant 2 [Blastomyces dermatitidis ER-3]OAT02881.1 hypothetical protein BDCG_08586 [Blastomyces dermatitidis ER-3]OAT02882.1 hypothetical protein, variant 1 [Blastomyces dermatitidis ER-3]